jgi:hypothetical protein
MHHGTMIADARVQRRRWAGPSAAIVAAFLVASGAAAWMSDSTIPISTATASTDAPVSRIEQSFFDLRFSVHQAQRPSPSPNSKLQFASLIFAQKPTYEGGSPVIADEPAVTESTVAESVEAAPAIPLPRPRPSDVNLALRDPGPPGALRDGSSPAALRDASPPARDNEGSRTEDPTLLKKLSGLYRLTLASLTPTDGIFAKGPDLAALGYDSETAVYDISAQVVYLPNGSKLEAHSGLGDARDDPRHVSEHKVGSTPPAVYDLKPREQLFHGVQALRMAPVEGSALGRTGLLVHSYMLGPNGDSNGCVSVRDYDRFLAAFQKGEFKRLAVVSSLGGSAAQSVSSASGGANSGGSL